MIVRTSNKGFSLIELMMVVSIISLLSLVSLPKYNRFKIRAARAEVALNLKYFNAAAASYYSEHSSYIVIPGSAPIIIYGFMEINGVKFFQNCAHSSAAFDDYLGIKFTDCTKLRYRYSFYGDSSASSTMVISSGVANKYVAFASAFSRSQFGTDLVTGNPPINRNLCPNNTYSDIFVTKEDGIVFSHQDALADCT